MKYTSKLCLIVALAFAFIAVTQSYQLSFLGPDVVDNITSFTFTIKKALKKGDTIAYGTSKGCNLFTNEIKEQDFFTHDGEYCTLSDSNLRIAKLEIPDEEEKESDCDTLKDSLATKLFTVKALEDISSGQTIRCKAKVSKNVQVSNLPVIYQINEDKPVSVGTKFPEFDTVVVTDVSFKEKNADYTLSFRTNKVGPIQITPSCSEDGKNKDDRSCEITTDNVYCDDNRARLFTNDDGKTFIYVEDPNKKITCHFNFWSVVKNDKSVTITFDDAKSVVTEKLKLKIPKDSIQSTVSTSIVKPDGLIAPSQRRIFINLFTPSLEITKGTTLHLVFSSSEKSVDIKQFVQSLSVNDSSQYKVAVSSTQDGLDLTYDKDYLPLSFRSQIYLYQDLSNASNIEFDLKIKVTDVRNKSLSDVKNGLTAFIRSYFQVQSFNAELVGTNKQQAKITMVWKPRVSSVTSKWFTLFRFDKNVNKSGSVDCSVEIEGANVQSSAKYYYGDIIVSSDVDVDLDQEVTVTCRPDIDRQIGQKQDLYVSGGGDIVGNVQTQQSFDISSHTVKIETVKNSEVDVFSFDLSFGVRLDIDANQAKAPFFKTIASYFKNEDTASTRINEKLDAFVAKVKTISGFSSITRKNIAYLGFVIDIERGFKPISPFESSKGDIERSSSTPITLRLGFNMNPTKSQIEAFKDAFPSRNEYVVDTFGVNVMFVDDVKEEQTAEKACFGTSAFGVPGCAQQLPGSSCNHHAQCYQGACYDKKCQVFNTYAPYANSVSALTTTLGALLVALALFILA